MATVRWEASLAVSAERAWAALRRVDMAHKLFSPVLTESVMEDNVRTVTFANGLVVRERVITVDEERKRIAFLSKVSPSRAHVHGKFSMCCGSAAAHPVHIEIR